MRVRGDLPGRHIDVGGTSLYVETGGREIESALPLVVMIHGAGQNAVIWRDLADHLASHGMSLLAVDLPGHGRSTSDAHDTVGEYAEIVAALIRDTDHRSATVIGHSLGGLVALHLAAEHPDVVDRLVLMGTGLRVPVNENLLEGVRAEDADWYGKMAGWSHSRTADAARALTETLHQSLRVGVMHAALTACDTYAGGADHAAAVDIPTAILIGEHDVMIVPEEVTALAEAIPHAEVVTIPDAGHNLMLDQPGATITAVEEFLAAHESSV